MFFDQKKLTDAEIEAKEQEFAVLVTNPAESERARAEMQKYFSTNSMTDYKYGYWRWCVELTWRNLYVLSTDDFVTVVVKQSPTALLLNYDVLFEMMWYLGMKIKDEPEMQGLFVKLKKEFLQSEAVVGLWQNKNVTVAELVKEIDSVYKSGDSLAVADFESRLRQIMFPDETAKKYFTADPEQAKERFLDLVSFFQTFTQENIWYVVDAFLNPEKYQNVAPGQPPTATTPVTPTQAKPALAPQPKPRPLTPAPKPVVPPPAPKSTVPTKPTLQQIKSQIESQFKKDAEGNFADIEGVMAKLGELAEKYNDPKIAEMIYFDEKENKFKWNI